MDHPDSLTTKRTSHAGHVLLERRQPWWGSPLDPFGIALDLVGDPNTHHVCHQIAQSSRGQGRNPQPHAQECIYLLASRDLKAQL